MKKFRILTPLMAATAAVAPTIATLGSCSKINYTAITETLKETMINEFLALSKIPRMTWMCHEIYNYIQDRMEEFGFAEPIGFDNWSDDPEVKIEIAKTKVAYKADDASGLKNSRKHTYWGSYGNIWYDIPATAGFEDRPKIMMQAHYDMNIAFAGNDEDPTKLESFKEWKNNGIDVHYNITGEKIDVNGQKTSLGADNGLGVAGLLAVAKHHKEFKHGPIRLMFTADESGATKKWYSGMHYLLKDEQEMEESAKPLKGIKYIISTDGETKGYIYNSVAGLKEYEVSSTNLKGLNRAPNSQYKYSITVSGLSGGHSAYDINAGYANALQTLFACITHTSKNENFHIMSTTCNSGAYQICSNANAVIYADIKPETLQSSIDCVKDVFKSQYPKEKNLNIEIKQLDKNPNDKVLTYEQTLQICTLGSILQYGPISWFDNPEHTDVMTSSNFGPLEINFNNATGGFNFDFHSVVRSANKLQLDKFYQLVTVYFQVLTDFEGLTITETSDPVWEKEENNKMVNLAQEAFDTLKISSKQCSSHAWLEMSCLPVIYNELGYEKPVMVCFGPDIAHSHETTEYTNTDTFDAVLKGMFYMLEFSDKLGK